MGSLQDETSGKALCQANAKSQKRSLLLRNFTESVFYARHSGVRESLKTSIMRQSDTILKINVLQSILSNIRSQSLA